MSSSKAQTASSRKNRQTLRISSRRTSNVSSPRATVVAVIEPSSFSCTCAASACNVSSLGSGSRSSTGNGVSAADFILQLQDAVEQRLGRRWTTGHVNIDRYDTIAAAYHRVRSEERRVGKECRSRWSPY